MCVGGGHVRVKGNVFESGRLFSPFFFFNGGFYHKIDLGWLTHWSAENKGGF